MIILERIVHGTEFVLEERMFKSTIMKVSGMALIGIGMASACLAIPATPEIDAATGANALALVAGALLVIRGRRK